MITAAIKAIIAWFDRPSPADPAELANTMEVIFHPPVKSKAGLDRLEVGAVVRDKRGLVLEAVLKDSKGNLWYQTGSPEALTTDAITLPAVVIWLGVE
jgi:hypothetical protein